jgi:formamidopyrimidine-DNA glycosylase
MTGQLIWEACPGETEFCLKKSRVAGGHPSPDWVAKLPNKHTRAIFSFDNKSVLFFNDVRRFGYLKLYKKSELKEIAELKKLGPEPFSKEFNIKYLIKRAEKIPNRKIKQFIIDQEIISGVGNIYVDEALFYAGILPTRAVKDISKTEWQKIIQSITKALELGLKYGGSSEDTYVDAFGNPGTMNNHTKVYRKKGQPCGKCGTKVERIVLGGRGTHFCPVCQK